MENTLEWVEYVRSLVWSTPVLFLILGTGAYLTFILKGLQITHLGYAFKETFAKQRQDAEGDISHFEALMTTLAGAIGTGSIVGVSTAIAIGGMGALFWMWVTAFFGMATKYAESLLAVKYREKDHRGEMIGGPMEYIEKGLGWKWMALLFAIFGVMASLGTGNLVQVNSIADALSSVWSIDPLICGIVTAFFTGLVILGGVKSIGRFTGIIVPFMSLFYLIGGLIIIAMNYDQIPSVFATIFKSAFSGQAAIGGFAGSTMYAAIQMGVARGVFSNEAGLGISSIAAAAAKTDSPGRQALIFMTGTLMSTLVVCTITGLVIGVSGVFGTTGSQMAIRAFETSLSGGNYVVSIGLILFAFSTVIAWGYYGEKCAEYLFGERVIYPFRILYTLIIIPGSIMQLELVWALADISNALMALPNLFTLIALSGVIIKETEKFKNDIA